MNLYWVFDDWLKQGYFPLYGVKGIFEPGQVTCTEQASTDWLT